MTKKQVETSVLGWVRLIFGLPTYKIEKGTVLAASLNSDGAVIEINGLGIQLAKVEYEQCFGFHKAMARLVELGKIERPGARHTWQRWIHGGKFPNVTRMNDAKFHPWVVPDSDLQAVVFRGAGRPRKVYQ